jgi:hypothetical protein
LYGYRFNFTCYREAKRSLEKELQDLSAHRDSLDITDESLDKRIHDIEKELE